MQFQAGWGSTVVVWPMVIWSSWEYNRDDDDGETRGFVQGLSRTDVAVPRRMCYHGVSYQCWGQLSRCYTRTCVVCAMNTINRPGFSLDKYPFSNRCQYLINSLGWVGFFLLFCCRHCRCSHRRLPVLRTIHRHRHHYGSRFLCFILFIFVVRCTWLNKCPPPSLTRPSTSSTSVPTTGGWPRRCKKASTPAPPHTTGRWLCVRPTPTRCVNAIIMLIPNNK